MMDSRLALKMGGTVAVMLAAIFIPGAASATTTSVPGASGTAEHCVQGATPRESNVVAVPVCFDSYAKSVTYLTGGRVSLLPNARYSETTTALQSKINREAIAAGTFVLSIEYWSSRFRDSTFTWTGAYDCNQTSYQTGQMPSGWNDKIGSSKAYSYCVVYHHEHNNFAGSIRICYTTTDCSDLGVMNDRTSSMRWL